MAQKRAGRFLLMLLLVQGAMLGGYLLPQTSLQAVSAEQPPGPRPPLSIDSSTSDGSSDDERLVDEALASLVFSGDGCPCSRYVPMRQILRTIWGVSATSEG